MTKVGYKQTPEHRLKIAEAMKRVVRTPEHRRNIAAAKLGEKNGVWKGEAAGYQSKHTWVQKHFGQPGTCENCGISGLSGQKINWANLSGEYRRVRDDWMRLCKSCHNKHDRYGHPVARNYEAVDA